jgi:hypothetical protein
MPRGSDADAAGEELKARTGFTPNAEDMIAENTARFTEELRAASNRPVDQEATDEMDEDEAQGYVEGDDETVVNWAVRGPFVVLVTENDETGEVTKQVHAIKGQEKKAERLATRGQAKKADDEADDDDEPKAAPRATQRTTSGTASK